MKTTKIEWADSTASPFYGCTKVSPGCANCYAENWAKKFGKDCWGPGKPRIKSKSFDRDCRRWNAEVDAQANLAMACDGPPGQEPPRPRIFPSLCDWLDPEVPAEWLADLLRTIHDCPNLDFLLLTKRPELWSSRIDAAHFIASAQGKNMDIAARWLAGTPPENVWIGVSCEDQKRLDQRNPELLRTPAAFKFLSLEPLLGPLNLKAMDAFDWVIVGGESGPKARPCNIEWIRDIIRQCRDSKVPCFVKQLGRLPAVNQGGHLVAYDLADPKGGAMEEWPEDLRVREMPKQP